MSHQGQSAQADHAMTHESDLEPSDEGRNAEGQSQAPKHPQDPQQWIECTRCGCWRKVGLQPSTMHAHSRVIGLEVQECLLWISADIHPVGFVFMAQGCLPTQKYLLFL